MARIPGMISTVAVAAAAIAVSACSARPAASVSDMAAVRSAVSTIGTDSPAAGVRRGLLREFLTVHGRGYFYTAYGPEARSAVKKFHFKATGRTFGYVDAARQKRTVPLYRLHLVGRQSYLVTADKQEKNSLLASGKFTLDGVLGYIPLKAAAGRFPVWRLDHGPRPYWRLATTVQERRLRRHGWHLDGLIGFMFRKR
jgi:hypothetical protein